MATGEANGAAGDAGCTGEAGDAACTGEAAPAGSAGDNGAEVARGFFAGEPTTIGSSSSSSLLAALVAGGFPMGWLSESESESSEK